LLFERTAISKKPELLAKQEIQNLTKNNEFSPDLVFRDHYGTNSVKDIFPLSFDSIE